jgi:hypothetical protein
MAMFKVREAEHQLEKLGSGACHDSLTSARSRSSTSPRMRVGAGRASPVVAGEVERIARTVQRTPEVMI